MVKRKRNILRQSIGAVMKIPGTVETYLTLSDLFGKIPSFDSSWRHLPGWLKEYCSDPDGEIGSEKRILFFSLYPRWVDYSLAMSVLMIRYGADIDFLWLPNRFPLPGMDARGNPYWFRSAKTAESSVRHPRFRIHNLSATDPAGATAEMEQFASEQARIDVSYLLRKERIRIEPDHEDGKAFEFRKQQNLDAQRRVAAFLEGKAYDRIIMPSGGILEFGAVFRYLKACGLSITTIETCDAKGKIWVSNNAAVVNVDTTGIWEKDAPHILTGEKKDRVQKIIDARQSPKSNQLQIEYQKSLPDPQEVTRKKLGLKPGMPVVLVCPNVPFDAIFYNGGKSIFEGMWDWLGLSARFLGERKDCKVIIRCHPAEPHYDTIETSRSILNEFLQDLPGNILLVPPQDPVSTYSLMDVADLGLVYASTTGLEMAMRGIPVVCGNPFQHYNGKGFTHDPSSREEYFSMIDRILANPGLYRLSDRQVELAWCYADVYFNQWYIPFPWPGGPLWPHLKEWPMERMISGEGASKIERTINVLLGN